MEWFLKQNETDSDDFGPISIVIAIDQYAEQIFHHIKSMRLRKQER